MGIKEEGLWICILMTEMMDGLGFRWMFMDFLASIGAPIEIKRLVLQAYDYFPDPK